MLTSVKARLCRAALVALVVGLAACGTTSATSSGASTASSQSAATSLTVAAAGKQYLVDIGPPNTAITNFNNQANSWTSDTADAQAEAAATPLITALRQFQSQLLDTDWPSASTSDVKGLDSAIGPLIGDLEGLSTLNLLDLSSWTSTFERDATSLGTQDTIVRHDFGLPPPS